MSLSDLANHDQKLPIMNGKPKNTLLCSGLVTTNKKQLIQTKFEHRYEKGNISSRSKKVDTCLRESYQTFKQMYLFTLRQR